jgi:5'-methylthioadenosine phosphorylase
MNELDRQFTHRVTLSHPVSNKIAIIGGTGFEKPDILQNPGIVKIETPYGQTPVEVKTGMIAGTEVCLVSRHGPEHQIPPTHVNNRAHIRAVKELGCTHIIATTACGSLKKEIAPGDLVFPDQFIDFTRFRPNTFFDRFEPGQLHHVPMADPFDADLRELLIQTAKQQKLWFHDKGTVITIEGPRFSTRAESRMFKSWGADIINMSTAPECILANEMEIPYAAVAVSTDYDSWMEEVHPVTWEAVLQVFSNNIDIVTKLIVTAISAFGNNIR